MTPGFARDSPPSPQNYVMLDAAAGERNMTVSRGVRKADSLSKNVRAIVK